MANTRSGGGGDAPPPPSSPPAAASATATRKLADGRETRNTAAASAHTPNLRRSTRENKGKHKSRLADTPPLHRSAKTPTKDATAIATPKSTPLPNNPKDSTKKPSRVRNTSVSPSPSKQEPNETSTPASTKRKTQDDALTASTPSKKQKRLLHAKSYIALFNIGEESVLATLREDEEKASEVQPEGDGAVLVHEESNAPEQPNQEASNVVASEVLGGHSSDLHEIEVILEGDGLKIGSHQSDVVLERCILTETRSLNKAVESIPMLETGEQATGGSNQKPLLELPNSACSTAHHEEASKSVEDGNSIGIQGACTSRNTEAIQCDETWYDDNICVVCRSREISDILKSCGGKGCKRHYHLSCMDPSLDVSLGIWLCIMCMKKRIQFGVYSVSEGIESLWDVKEGVVNSKQYFVKYKNLAHVHNQWVSESDIVDSTPQGSDLISKVSKKIHKEKTIRWKQEWAEPHRLLKRRLLMPQKEAEVFFNSLGDKFVYCNVEWLVKWKDLGYEHATWELESSSFLCTPEAEELKRSYEDRFKTARKASDPSKVDKAKGGIFQQLERLPDGCPPGLDDDHLRSLNQLREFWHNSCGAIFIDDQERVIKTILFVASILPHICQPLLIVSTTTTLSLWETKFNRLAASINVVVYNGEKDVRKSIQDLEFYQDGSVMLQVLLSHPDAILEDIEVIERINWEAVIVDDCQNSRVSKWLEQLRRLPTNFRMVLLSSSLKESIAEHISLLSFLNPEENGTLSVSNGVSFDTAGTLVVLKEKLARYVAFERKTDSSKLLEYWVPARLSPVQLEMYCYILLSNSPALRSHSKTDSVGALRNILISLRKCCDHPYLVDQSLQSTLTKDHPVTDILDIGVRSCGKLLLLDRMLQQIRIQGLRVLILSQSGGESGKPMGDILDDFVRQRFGYESYERVERGLLLQKKQTAMNMFNDKTKGRFIFLIDSRACGPSIKLSSVDAIIIYCSDWNPMNDLRALQRVSMESQSEPVPIFRLYSSFTVEEKALILAKHDHILDSNIVNITPSLSHCLLSWGASFLFNRLEELQQHSYSNVSGDELFMDNVDLEFLTKLLSKVELRTESGNTAISQAYLCGSFYSRAIVVAGEREGIPSVDGDLPKFWAYWLSLLNGRSPQWQYISEPVQRSRRKINNMEQQLKNTDKQLKITTEETDEARVKRRRIGEIMDSSAIDSPGKNKDTILPGNNTPPSSHQISVEDTWQELERSNLHATQKGLHVQLKPEISKLYKLLQLPEPSSDDLRSTDHVEENTVGSQIQGGTSKHLGDAAMEVETGNRNTALADSPHFDKPALTAPSRQATLLVSRETEMLSNLVDQCAQQSLVSAQPLQDESEQADLSSAASTQPLQSERQQLISVSNNLLERAQLDQSQPNYQTDAAPGCAQSTELFPVTSMMFNHAPIDSEPLKNELHKLRLHMDTLNKVHEMKKTQLQTACSQELEKVKRKYDLLIKEHDSTHLQQKKALGDFYEKVQRNQSLAEDFRAKFISLSAAQGAAKGHTPPVRHTPQATQVVSSTSSIALSSACRPPVPRPRVQAPQVDQPLLSLSQFSRPSLQVVQPPNLELGNLFRATSTTLSHMPPQRGSYGVQSELAPRSPAPHLQFRSPRAHSMAPGNQQQSPAISVDAMSSRTQPVLAASTSPSDIHVGPLAASALSSLHSVLPSTSLPSSLHPSHLAQRVPPTPNPTLQAGAPKGSNATMPSIPTGMQLPDSGSLSLDAWLTANLGLNDASTAPAKDTASLGLSSDAPRAAPDTNTASLGLSSDVPRGTAPATNTASLGLSSDVPRGTTPATTTTSLGLISDSPRVIAPASSNSPGAIASATNGGSEIDVVCLSDDE
ncbi:Helicase protein MOM1 [Zea mays]|uniref:Helicase protein MOM1 n=1 Tax=Zea mays TaxID=4577 RepID=A0A1D6NXU5_MAIZE|nr:Helicase protein MOM1 [Zea mays]